MRLFQRGCIVCRRPQRVPIHIAVIVGRVDRLHRIAEDAQVRIADLPQQPHRLVLVNAGILVFI